jgi:FtsP/CotA-like multicopper oxidase with cupredoxin domain
MDRLLEGFGAGPSSREPSQGPDRSIARRALFGAVLAVGAGTLGTSAAYVAFRQGNAGPVPSSDIARAEAARRRSGRVRTLSLRPRRTEVDLGGRVVTALTYGGDLPGAEVRVQAGDLLRVEVHNELDRSTSVHWHGLAIRNDADGVPGVTSPETGAGDSSRFEFVVPDPGTHWFHPHSGLQLEWGLYAPLIVDHAHEPGAYDHELVVVLDDWTAGLGMTPEQLLKDLRAGDSDNSAGPMPGMDHGTDMSMSGMSDAGDVQYPAYLANGRLPEAASSLAAKPGQRVRLRLINAAGDTTFDVALADHRMTVTHTDGFPVQPVDVDSVRISMGERYDATVTMADGVFPLVAVPLGKAGAPARVLVRTGGGAVPGPDVVPDTLRQGRRLALPDLVADISVRQERRKPDSVQDVVLGGDMASYRWTINGRGYGETRPLTVQQGEYTRLRFINRTTMLHPVHLHGHTFALSARFGARKDTVLVPAKTTVDVDVVADNPGAWMLHCHNAFHMEAGMMTRLEYVT